jgi:hypothetical protein
MTKSLLFTIAALLASLAIPAWAMDMMGEHDMSGTVQKVDHKKGTFELKTHEGVLRLHFPPGAVKDVKSGDALTVHLGFKKGGSGMPMK